MTSPGTPRDPEQLRAEIAQTRAELGETVQELAAKADVKTRAQQAIGNATGIAGQKLAAVKDRAAQKASTAKHQLADSDLPGPIRRPLPLAAIAAAAAAVIVTIVVVARRGRS